MKKLLPIITALAALSGTALLAQDISGTWQGTLHGPGDLRLVMKISKADTGGGYKAMMYSIDQGAQPIPAGAVTLLTGFRHQNYCPRNRRHLRGKAEQHGRNLHHWHVDPGRPEPDAARPDSRHRQDRLGNSGAATAASSDG